MFKKLFRLIMDALVLYAFVKAIQGWVLFMMDLRDNFRKYPSNRI